MAARATTAASTTSQPVWGSRLSIATPARANHGAAEQLQHAGRHPPPPELGGMAAEAPVVTRPGQVVEQAEEGEAERDRQGG